MPIKQTLSPRSRLATPKRKRRLIILAIVVAILLALWGVAEYSYQLKINKLSTAVQKVGSGYVEPAGGVANSFGVKAPHFLDSFCIDNGPCPMVTKGWTVLIAPDQEASYVRDVFQKTGYQGDVSKIQVQETTNRDMGNGVTLSVGFYHLAEQPPYQAPPGKEWKSFDVSATESLKP